MLFDGVLTFLTRHCNDLRAAFVGLHGLFNYSRKAAQFHIKPRTSQCLMLRNTALHEPGPQSAGFTFFYRVCMVTVPQYLI